MDLTSSQHAMFRSLSRLELCRGRHASYMPETEEQEEDLMDLVDMGLAAFDGSEYRISGKGRCKAHLA